MSLHAQSDFFAYGLAVEQRLMPRLAAVAEVAGHGIGKGVPGADRHAEARAGLRLGAGRLRWDAAVRRGLGAADGGWGLTLGVGWTARGPGGP